MNSYFFIFEAGSLLALMAIFYHERKNRNTLEILALSSLYGMILEALNIYMSKEVYTYNSAFFFEIAGVPLAIGAGWAVVYYLAKSATDRFSLAWWQSPIVMALIALSYDLSLDAIAIRLGFWTWKIPLNEEWFGVPYDNFYGWLAVVWTFGLFVNLSYQEAVKPRLAKAIRYAAPVVSALLLGMEIMVWQNLAAVLSGKFSWGEVMALYAARDYSYAYVPEVRTMRVYMFAVLLLGLSAVCISWIYSRRREIIQSADRFPILVASSAHLTYIVFLFASGIYKVSWLLPLVSFGAFALSLYLELGRYGERKH